MVLPLWFNVTGIERFLAGLQELGIECEQRGDLAVATLDVAPPGVPGPHQVGADPPNDFPNVPPHWLHLDKALKLSEGQAQDSDLGGEWLKWSRKHPNWQGGQAAAREWLAHARSLLMSATRA